MSTTSSGLTLNMTNTIQADRYPEFSCVPGHQGSDSPQSSALAPAYSKSGKWESSSGIWGINGINGIKNIGSSLSNTGRDVSIPRSAGNNDFADRPSGSSALTASSEADPWLSSPWNNANVASPATLSSNASISPPHTQNSNSTTNQNALLKVQNAYQQQQPTRHAFRHSASFSRSQSKSNIDPSSNIKFTRKSSAPYDGKENLSGQSPLQQDKYETDFSRRLPIGSSATRDGSVSQSETTEWGFNNVNTNPLHGNGDTQFGSGGNNAANGFSQSQPTNFSNLPFSRATHTNAQHPDFSASEVEVSEKLGTLRLGHNPEQPSLLSKNIGANFSSQNPHFPLQGFPLLDDSMMWAEGPKPMNSYQSYWGQLWSNQMYVNKPQRFPEKGPLPFSTVDNRRGLNSPKYRSRPTSAAPIPPSQSGSSRSRISQGSGHLERKASTLAHSPAHPHMLGSQLQNQPSLQLYELLPNTLRSGFPYNNPMLMQSYTSLQVVPSRLGKDHDLGVRIRSQLLEEFRANTKFNKRYELKDIYHHIVEFSGDQHGSRFIQTKLETANSDEKEQVFREIQPNALQLMTDVFGNYVIQKLFEHGNQVQKRVLAEQMKNHVMELSLQMYGCRVVQKALEHVLADQQAHLVDELQADVLRCVKDQNGNHVVQKAIERVPSQHIQFIIDAFRGQIENLATHPYGCRVIQRILEFCKPHDQASILRELHECSQLLITDQYGNYVTQHVIQHGKPEDREKIINLVIGQLLTLSKHKFASNVVEKSIIHGTEQQRRVMASLLTASNTDGTNSLQLMMKDQFGNYVIQKLIAQLQGVEKAAFLNDMKPQLLLLKKYNYGKQIAVIEKLVFSAPQSSQSTTGPSQPKDMPVTRINSNTPSPTLNDAQISPRNNCFPSTKELSNST